MTGRQKNPARISVLRCLTDWQIVPVAFIAAALVLLPNRLPLYAQGALLLGIPLLWLAHRLVRGRFWTPHPLDLPLLILVATLPVGLWASPLPQESLPLALQRIAAIALLYATVNTLNTGGKLRLATATLLIGTALLSFLILIGMRQISKFPVLPQSILDRIPHRVLSFWNPESKGFHTNIMAGLLALFIPITVAYAFFAIRRPLRRWKAVGIALLWGLVAAESLVLLYTQSRGGIIGLAAAMLVVAIARDRRWLWILPLVAATVGGAIAFYGIQPFLDLLPADAGSGAMTSGAGRLELASRGLYMIQDFAFTGIGLGTFPSVLSLLYPLFLISPEAHIPHAHNIYLQAGIEHGIPGLIAFLAMLILLATMGVQAVRWSREQWWEPLAVGLLAGLVAFLVHGLVDVITSSPRVQLLVWSHWGTLTAVWLHARAQRTTDGA